MNQEKVFEAIRKAAVQAIDVDEEEVQMESRLIDDLEAESLDIIDLLFKTGKELGVKISMKEVQESIRDGIDENVFFNDEGIVSEEGIIKLKEKFGDDVVQDFSNEIKTKDLLKLLDIQYLVKLFVKKAEV
jgi:acyl carrier protein